MASTGIDHFVMAITSDVRNKTYQKDDHHSATTEECSHDDDECQPVLQEFMLNLSAKRRLCNTVGKRFIDGTARCCAVSIARSRAAATTNFARSNQSLALRFLFAGAKSFALSMSACLPPCRLVTSRPRPNSAPRSRPSHGSRDPVLGFGSQCRGKERRLDQPPYPQRGCHSSSLPPKSENTF
jgi:hypothetical protein